MSIRKIFEYPAPVLRQQTRAVTVFDDDLKKLAEDMAETMYDAPGIGLAAPQIGVDLAVVVFPAEVVDRALEQCRHVLRKLPNVQVLLAECRNRMPAYMVPHGIDVRSGPLPRNPNGKIDRKTLSTEWIESKR